MANTYSTISGDMWDIIALKTLGSEIHTDKLIEANRQYKDVFIFSAGVSLVIPEVEKAITPGGLPPWKRGNAV